MAFQSMLIILVGAVPEYYIETVTGESDDITQSVKFEEDVSSIVTEASDCHQFSTNFQIQITHMLDIK